jgi:CBS domain-containing protein
MNTVSVRGLLETKGYKVHSIGPDATVLDALEKMAAADVGALAVLERGQLVGILSERDYARKVVLRGRLSKDTPVREIMTRDPVCVEPSHPVELCMTLMTDKRVRHLPVLQDGKLLGMISIGDVVRAIIHEQKFEIQQLEQYIHGRP